MRSRSSSLAPRGSPCLQRGLPSAPGRAPRATALKTPLISFLVLVVEGRNLKKTQSQRKSGHSILRRSGRETPPREAGRSEGTECRCVPEPGRRGENGRGPRGERRRMRARAVRRLLRRVHWIITGSFTGLVTTMRPAAPQMLLKKRRISAWGAAFEATPPLAGRRSGHNVKNRPPVCPSTVGNQGPLQRP